MREAVRLRLPGHATQGDRVLAVDGRSLELRPVLVRRVDVLDRPLAGPLGRQQQDADESALLRGGRGREHGLRAALEPGLAGSVGLRLAARLDPDGAEEQVTDARTWMRVPVGDPARREIDPVVAHQPAGPHLDRRREQRVVGLGVEQLPGQHRAVVELLDDRVLRVVRRAGEGEDQWKYWPPSITIVWPVMKSAAGCAEEDDRADDVLRQLVALDRSSGNGDVAKLLDHLGVGLDTGSHREPGRDAVDVDPVLAELLRQRTGEGDDRALRGHVVEQERHAAEGRPRRDVHDLAAALLPHRRHCRPAGQEHRGDVDVHHLPPLLERDLRERPHRQGCVEAGVVDQDVQAAVPVERLVDHPLHVLLVRDIRADAALGRVQVGDHDRRGLGREPLGDRRSDPLRAAGDERDLALEATHLSGENEVGIRIRFSWVWISGWIFARKATQRLVRLQLPAAPRPRRRSRHMPRCACTSTVCRRRW